MEIKFDFSRILKDTFFLILSSIISKAFTFFFIIFAVRTLKAENFGIYGLILSILAIFTIISDFGLQSLTIREVSRDKNSASQYLSHNLILKIVLVFLSYLGLYFFVIISNYPSQVKNLILIAGFGFVADSFRNTFNAYFFIYERTDILSFFNVFGSFMNAVSGIIVLILGFGLKGIIIQTVLMNWLLFIVVFLIVIKKFVRFEFKIKYDFVKKVIKGAFPFAMLTILSVIYFKIDTVLLSMFQNARAVGIYSAPYKLVEVLMFIPASLAGVLFPFVSYFSINSSENLLKSYQYSVKILLIIILPVAIITIIFGEQIVLLALGNEFTDSGFPLKILMLALIIIFINAPAGNIIYNSNYLYSFIKWAGLNTLLNFILNLIFIPAYSYNGAAFVTLITEMTGAAINFYFLKKIFV
ncbi:MAG: flippase [bacterium]